MAGIQDVSEALGLGSGDGGDEHAWGTVKAVNEDGSYQVRVGAASGDTRCARLCDAAVGDRVLVCVLRSGRAAAVGRVGGCGLSDVTSGTLPVARGGTGATTAAAALASLGALPLSGGTMTGRITRSSGGTWIKARDNASVYNSLNPGNSGSSFNPGVAMKSYSGAWALGTLNDQLYLSWGSDANYSAGTNSASNYSFDTSGNYSGKAANVTGTVAVANGGTGLTSSPSMLTNLGSTSAANVMQASPRPGVTGTLPVANGGTGATTAAAACSNLGALRYEGRGESYSSSGGWYLWRKYYDGTFEYWRSADDVCTCSSSYEGLYYGTYTHSYPFTITQVYSINVQARCGEGLMSTNVYAQTTTGFSTFVMSAKSGLKAGVRIYVCGRYK